jgi:hypothetical protein
MGQTTKVDESYFELTGIKLAPTSQLRLFDVMLDTDRETKFLNIFKNYSVNQDILTNVNFFDTYEVEGEGEAWLDNISFDVYGTPFLWWVIAIFNDISNPFEELEPGSNLTILKPSYLYTLFKDIEAIAEL